MLTLYTGSPDAEDALGEFLQRCTLFPRVISFSPPPLRTCWGFARTQELFILSHFPPFRIPVYGILESWAFFSVDFSDIWTPMRKRAALEARGVRLARARFDGQVRCVIAACLFPFYYPRLRMDFPRR